MVYVHVYVPIAAVCVYTPEVTSGVLGYPLCHQHTLCPYCWLVGPEWSHDCCVSSKLLLHQRWRLSCDVLKQCVVCYAKLLFVVW